MSERIWQLTALVAFPNHLPAQFGADGGPPEVGTQLVTVPRIPDEQLEVGGIPVRVRPATEKQLPNLDFRFSTGEVIVRIESDGADDEVIDLATPVFDAVLENLSFQLQFGLQIGVLEVLDLTGNPGPGDTREFLSYTGFSTPTLRPTAVPMESLAGRLVPTLTIPLDRTDRRVNRALDWYLKALSSPFEIDHFICLWIACDLLAGISAEEITAPYRTSCGHTIEFCPDCESSIERKVLGETVQNWLVSEFGIDPVQAKQIWEVRQILHGRDAFDAGTIAELPTLNQILRFIVVQELKTQLGFPKDEPPFAMPDGLSIIPQIGAGGETQVTTRDLEAFV